MYIIFALLTNFRIIVEQHTAKGRIDITMETDDTIYVMELKFNKSAEEALAQIEAKHYVDAFDMSGKKVVKIGLNFSVKDEVKPGMEDRMTRSYSPVYFLMALINVSPYFLILNSPIPLMRPNAWRVVGFIFVNSCRLLSDSTMYGG